MIKWISVSLLAVLGVSAVNAQNTIYGLKVGAGFFFPTDSFTKDIFGDTWTRLSFSPTRIQTDRQTRLDFDMQVLSRNSNSNRLFIISPSLGIRSALNSDGQFKPYVAARAGIGYADYRILGTSSNGILLNTNFELGAVVGDRFRIFGRYDLFSKRDGLDFSGFSINAELAVFTF